MPAKTLKELCTKAAISHIRGELSQVRVNEMLLTTPGMTDVGDLPYDVLRPILLRLENPEQLVCIPSPSDVF